jgi:hypothetical protein
MAKTILPPRMSVKYARVQDGACSRFSGESGSSRASLAETEELEVVGHVRETVSSCCAARPTFEVLVLELNRVAAAPTDEMMMMLVGSALSVNSFAVLAPYDVDLAAFGHGLKIAINGRQTDPRPTLTQKRVDLLGAEKRLQIVHHPRYRPSLTCRSGTRD